ncbi:MaoC family dehydratase [Magnetovibrio sp. PR-2]|uniref:MaoC family dehydratase n=1 Tax=Magnetovibrio sp. PR-2 TaxID=3120356 RepID=UPI002FCE4FA1
MSNKIGTGNFFEDFKLGQLIAHATPRTVTEGDVALYCALYGSRFAVQSGDTFAMDIGYEAAPMDDLLVFHVVFGKSVPDISLNAVANLGYANGRMVAPVYAGDTLTAKSEVIGLKENSNGKTGVVYVHTVGENQKGEVVADFVRWVMVNKKDPSNPAPETVVPDLPKAVTAEHLAAPTDLDMKEYDFTLAGSPFVWEDYEAGEKIDHVDGFTVEEAEHALATRLYQNTARVHFNQHTEKDGRFGKRIVYGGHVISICRSITFNGLGNAFKVAAINGGRHVAPIFAGNTVYAWSEVLEKMEVPGHPGLGALRLRTVGLKDQNAQGFPYKDDEGKYDPAVVLDFDYTVLMPRRV